MSESSDKSFIPSREARSRKEKMTRPERVLRLQQLTEELFPGGELAHIRQNIFRSFDVPQAGEHHNEGMLMDTHLERIFNTLEDVSRGEFPDCIPDDIRVMLQRVISDPEHKQWLQKYVLLHDISKADCLNFTREDKSKRAITWQEWQAMVPEHVRTDPVALAKYFKSNRIQSIGYYGHEGEGARVVGPATESLDIPPILVKAIDKHGVAYSFSKIKLDTFEEHFGKMTREEMEWTVTASYIDSSASLLKNGQPDLEEFLNLCAAIHNFFVIQELDKRFQDPQALDPRKVTNFLRGLRKLQVRISESVEELVRTVQQECKYSSYDITTLRSNLEGIVIEPEGELLLPHINGIIAAIDPMSGRLDEIKLRKIKALLGKSNELLTRALEESEVKK